MYFRLQYNNNNSYIVRATPLLVAARDCRNGSADAPVVRISEKGAANVLGVHPYLMRAPGQQPPFHKSSCSVRKHLENPAQHIAVTTIVITAAHDRKLPQGQQHTGTD